MALVADRDSVIAVAGATRRELMEKRISAELENLMEGRQVYQWKSGELKLPVTEGGAGITLPSPPDPVRRAT